MAKIIRQAKISTPNYGLGLTKMAKASDWRVVKDMDRKWTEFLREDGMLRRERNGLVANVNKRYQTWKDLGDKIESTSFMDPKRVPLLVENAQRAEDALIRELGRIRQIDSDLRYIAYVAKKKGYNQPAYRWAKNSKYSFTPDFEGDKYFRKYLPRRSEPKAYIPRQNLATQKTQVTVAPSAKIQAKAKGMIRASTGNTGVNLYNALTAAMGGSKTSITPPPPPPLSKTTVGPTPVSKTTVTRNSAVAKAPTGNTGMIRAQTGNTGINLYNALTAAMGSSKTSVTGIVPTPVHTGNTGITPPPTSNSGIFTPPTAPMKLAFNNRAIASTQIQTADELYHQIKTELGNKSWTSAVYAPEQLDRWRNLVDNTYKEYLSWAKIAATTKDPDELMEATAAMERITGQLAGYSSQINRQRIGINRRQTKKRSELLRARRRSNKLFESGGKLMGADAYMGKAAQRAANSPLLSKAERAGAHAAISEERALYNQGALSGPSASKTINNLINRREKMRDRQNMAHQYHLDPNSSAWTLMSNKDAYAKGQELVAKLSALPSTSPYKLWDAALWQAELDAGYKTAKAGGDYSRLKSTVQRLADSASREQKDVQRRFHQSKLEDASDWKDRLWSTNFFGVEQRINPMDQKSITGALRMLEQAALVSRRENEYGDYIRALVSANKQLDPLDPENRGVRRQMASAISHLGTDISKNMTPQQVRDMMTNMRAHGLEVPQRMGLATLERQAMLREAQASRWVQQQQLFRSAVANVLLPHFNEWGINPETGEGELVKTFGFKDLFTKRYWSRKGQDWKALFQQSRHMMTHNPREMFVDPLISAFKTTAVITAIASAMTAGAVLGIGRAVGSYGIQQATQRTSLRNMYNVAIPTSWRGGMRYEDFEAASFKDARLMRTDAYTLQENAMRLGMATMGARNAQGQTIVNSMDDVVRMNRTMSLMGRIAGISDADLAAFMIQIQQAIGKGKADIMDIKPMENRSPYMAALFATKILGLSGSSEMFKLMEEGRGDRTKGITAERILTGMMNPQVEAELIDLLRKTARTWPEVFAVMGSDIKQAMLPFTKMTEYNAGAGLGTELLGVSKFLAEEKLNAIGTLGDNIVAMLPSIENLPGLLTKGAATFGRLLEIGGGLTKAFGGLLPAIAGIGMALGTLSTAFLGVAAVIAAIPNFFVGLVQAKRSGMGWLDALKFGGMTALGGFEDSYNMLKATWVDLPQLTTMAREGLKGLGDWEENSGRNIKSWKFGTKGAEDALGEEANIAGPVGQINQNTNEIKKQGAKMQNIQLELLKQVSGRAVVNRVTRVAPNVIANVGTIKSGVEYDQFMRDLTRSVHLAVNNVAY